MKDTEVSLGEQIQVVAEVRKEAEGASKRKNEAFQKWLDDHEQLLANEKYAKSACQEAEEELRELTLKAYAETGCKNPAVGVGIREVTKLDYDPETADEWGWDHALALKLDVKAFESYVKAKPSDFAFVTITTEPIATIATNLEA